MTDPYAPNPIADAIRERDPIRYEQVEKVKAAPKLFAGGTADVPAFTASGIDPALLLRLPVGIRHAAAANPDITQVHRWFEDYADMPEAEIDHDGLRAAKLRVEDWLANTDLDTRTTEQRAADDEAEYASFYGPERDRVSHAAEQHRREQAGEPLLEDFDRIQARRSWDANQPSSEPAAPSPFAAMVAGWGSA